MSYFIFERTKNKIDSYKFKEKDKPALGLSFSRKYAFN